MAGILLNADRSGLWADEEDGAASIVFARGSSHRATARREAASSLVPVEVFAELSTSSG